MMKLALMQPYFFPYIGYFQLIKAVDKFVVFDTVNYFKRGWIKRNRCLINDSVKYFTLSIQNPSQNRLIIDTFIADEAKLHSKENIIKTLSHAYAKAPNFDRIFPLIKRLILNEEQNISLYNTNILHELCQYLNIKTEIILGSEVLEDSSKTGQDRIIEICEQFGAAQYVNPIGGVELYDKKAFADHNIELLFLKSDETIKYHQWDEAFYPNLSIIDVMMFNTVNEISDLLEQYSLI